MPTILMSSLVDRVPRKAVAYLIYSTDMVNAARARNFGIVSEVVPDTELGASVDKLCQSILKAPRPATLAVKEYLRAAPDMAIAGAVDLARNMHATINSAIDARAKRG
jgi:enoyl-CoA hydratase/carnithine racemase